jgi:hypothetical protein
MKTIYTIIITLLLLNTSVFSQCNELFISEYIEGSGNNKAIEIYNPTSDSIELLKYAIRRYSNGSTDYTSGGGSTSLGTSQSRFIRSLGTFVLVNGQTTSTSSSPSCDPELQALGNQLDGVYPAPTYLNGNDAIALTKSDVIIDIFGKMGEDPGTAWSTEFPYTASSGVLITKDHTMIRKSSVQTGVSVNPEFFDPMAQYDTLPKNTWTTLGTHDCICSTLNSIGDISLGTQYRNTKIRIFPNPILNNELNISSSKPISYIQISNLTGQVVFSSVNGGLDSSVMKVLVDYLPKGVYYLEVKHRDNTSIFSKIVR